MIIPLQPPKSPGAVASTPGVRRVQLLPVDGCLDLFSSPNIVSSWFLPTVSMVLCLTRLPGVHSSQVPVEEDLELAQSVISMLAPGLLERWVTVPGELLLHSGPLSQGRVSLAHT